jgi:hypothetical protein
MLASSTVYTVVTQLVIRVPSTADDDTGQLHCLPSGFDTVRATPDGVDSRGGEYCVRRRDLCMKHRTFFAAYFEPVYTCALSRLRTGYAPLSTPSDYAARSV